MYPRQIPVMWMHRPLQSKKERPFRSGKNNRGNGEVPQRHGAHRLEETTGAVSDDDLIDVTEQELR